MICPTCQKIVPPTHFYPRSRKPRCAQWLKWPLPRRYRLVELTERGYSDERIAREMDTTPAAIHIVRTRYRLPARRDLTLSAREVARKMGYGCGSTVTRWIEAGHLAGHQGAGRGPHPMWYVSLTALMDFIEDPVTWHLWRADRITDDRLRRLAISSGRDKVCYLSTGEVASRMYVEIPTVSGWIHKGWLPARRWGNWWVDERDLAFFQLPQIGGWNRKEAA